MTTRRRRRARGEDGAALELALIFLSATSVIVASLLGFAGTSSQATVVTRTARGSDYDADGAMQADIAIIRVSGSCTSFTTGMPALNNPSAPVWVGCTLFAGPASQRHVVLSVCFTPVTTQCSDTSALLRAEVIFYDAPTFGASLSIQSWSNQ